MTEALSRDSVRDIGRRGTQSISVLVVGTLDTKLEDIAHLCEEIAAQGAGCVVMDVSTRVGAVLIDGGVRLIAREQVARAAGASIKQIGRMSRGEAVAAMRPGVKKLTQALEAGGEVSAAVCIGGAGAHLAGPAFQALRLGFPKLIVSPLASGTRTFEPYVGLRDVAVLHSVADIAGVNAVTSRVYRETAGYIVGAARAFAEGAPAATDLPTIAVSMNGNTTPAVGRAKEQLSLAGLSCVAFHANGVGGRALEDFIASGGAVGVLDYTTTELSARILGGLMDPGPERMETAGRLGIPQVLVPGCVDFITCGRWDDTERAFPERRLFRHNPELTLVRLNKDEMRELGDLFARKANLATGPSTVCVPTRGFSVPDTEGGEFWDPEADASFIDALTSAVHQRVRVDLIDCHINDDAFADAAVTQLLALLDSGGAVTANALRVS
jgi:uncharacterized protein (UPF0261 family)